MIRSLFVRSFLIRSKVIHKKRGHGMRDLQQGLLHTLQRRERLSRVSGVRDHGPWPSGGCPAVPL